MGCISSKSITSVPKQEIANPTTAVVVKNPYEQKKSFASCYTLHEKLGKGQYAVVHRVTDRDNNTYAVKCIRKSALTQEDIDALEIEIKSMEILRSHPNFVKFYDFFDEPTYYFLVMEMITGGELFDRIVHKEKYTEREARGIMYQLVSAIAFAHSRGVVHRDLKPENILLRSREDDTTLKLADLGFAKILENSNQLMTTPCGTPGYVAPEVISGHPYSISCDIWSLGVILYILLCGYPPFSEEDQTVLFNKIRAGAYEMIPEDWKYISPAGTDLVKRILVVDPKRRITASEILSHPWMQIDASALPDVQLGNAITQLKRFNARRRLKAAMTTVRATVRTRMLLGARASLAAKKAGASDEEAQEAFMKVVSSTGNDNSGAHGTTDMQSKQTADQTVLSPKRPDYSDKTALINPKISPNALRSTS